MTISDCRSKVKKLLSRRIDVLDVQGNENNRNYLDKYYGVPRSQVNIIYKISPIWIKSLGYKGQIG
jgi:hypothetical protein